MKMKNAALVAFGVATIPAAVAAYFVHRDMTAHPELELADRVGGNATLGDERLNLLVKLTRAYAAHHPEAPAAIREGQTFAPQAFLNHELEVQGVKWRVRKIRGRAAETYNVS